MPEVDGAIDLLETHDANGLMEIVILVEQPCPQPDGRAGSQVFDRQGDPIDCTRVLEGKTVTTAGDDGWITLEPVFRDSTFCDTSYLQDESEIREAIVRILARDGEPRSSVYGVGRQSAINKNADGYVILLTPGDVSRGDAPVSQWYLTPEGALIAILDGCGIGDASTTAERTGALGQDLLEAPSQ